MFLAAGSALAASPPSPVRSLIIQAKQQQLAKTRAWRKLLFYDTKGFGRVESYIDSQEYFLAENGKYDPQAELEATIRGLYAPESAYDSDRNHPLCRYPARLKWLLKQLPIKMSELPAVTCEDLDGWLARRDYVDASLVFSSYYSGNPASLFGHTFIRLHHQQDSHALTDDAVNFVAYPWSQNPFLYAAAGVMGFFPGRFDLIPYFMKIQEYNNLESRDLWEYRLGLTPDEIDTMVRMIWELGPHHIDYYYFDDNCSAVLLKLLEGAKPELDLPFTHPWILPMDTLQTALAGIYRDRDAIKAELQPSSRNRFLSLYRGLSQDEQALVNELIRSDDVSQPLASLSQERQARVLDALIELIDYEEKLAASNPVKVHKQRRFEVLKFRSKNPTKPLRPGSTDEIERPDLANASSRIGPFLGYTNAHEQFYQLEWRPALTGIASSDAGFSPGLAIDFFKVKARIHPERGYRTALQEFSLLKIESYSDIEWIIRPPSWTLSLGHLTLPTCAGDRLDARDCGQTMLRGSVGYVFPFFGRFLTIGGLPLFGVGMSSERPGEVFGEVGLTGMMTLRFSPRFKLHYLHHQRAQYYSRGAEKVFPDGQVDVGYSPKRNHELRATFSYNRAYADSLIGYFYYW